MEDVEGIIQFGRRAGDEKILIHCFAGQSRSTAAAILILADRLGPGREEEALDLFLSLIHEAQQKYLRPRDAPVNPNRLMLHLGDRFLGRDKKLWKAIAKRTPKKYGQYKPPW